MMFSDSDPPHLVRQTPDRDARSTSWYARCMCAHTVERAPSGGARSKLLEAAFSTIREKGYAATSVDELCARAGVTKGAFFHHFPTKNSLAVAAMNEWSELSIALFAAAPYHRFDDRPRLPRFSQGNAARWRGRVHVSRWHDGSGGIQNPSSAERPDHADNHTLAQVMQGRNES
jgi:AcrR family transcriptional regulator